MRKDEGWAKDTWDVENEEKRQEGEVGGRTFKDSKGVGEMR